MKREGNPGEDDKDLFRWDEEGRQKNILKGQDPFRGEEASLSHEVFYVVPLMAPLMLFLAVSFVIKAGNLLQHATGGKSELTKTRLTSIYASSVTEGNIMLGTVGNREVCIHEPKKAVAAALTPITTVNDEVLREDETG